MRTRRCLVWPDWPFSATERPGKQSVAEGRDAGLNSMSANGGGDCAMNQKLLRRRSRALPSTLSRTGSGSIRANSTAPIMVEKI